MDRVRVCARVCLCGEPVPTSAVARLHSDGADGLHNAGAEIVTGVIFILRTVQCLLFNATSMLPSVQMQRNLTDRQTTGQSISLWRVARLPCHSTIA